jgi:hypothetical protein
MNQFRDILMVALIILAFGLGLSSDPDTTWTWTSMCGSYVVQAVHWLAVTKPWSVVILLALALSLFMTRLRY